MKTRKHIALSTLFKKAFSLVGKDYTVLLPYLISSFILVIIGSYLLKNPSTEIAENVSVELLGFYFLGWCFSLIAQATTIYMGFTLSKKRSADIADSFILSLKKFPLLAVLLLIAMLCLVAIGAVLNQLLQKFFIYAAIPLAMFILLFFQLFPVLILLEKSSFWNYYRMIFYFLKNNYNNLLRFFLGISIISLLSIMIISVVDSSTLAGKDIFSPLLQGLNGALITLLSVVFYLDAKTTISTNA